MWASLRVGDTEVATPGSRAFKIALVGGILLSVLVLAEAVISYRYVEERLVPEHLSGMAGQYVSLLENRARQSNAGGPYPIGKPRSGAPAGEPGGNRLASPRWTRMGKFWPPAVALRPPTLTFLR